MEVATPDERKLIDAVLAEGNYESVPFSKILQMIRKYRGLSGRWNAHSLSPTRRGRSCLSSRVRSISGHCLR